MQPKKESKLEPFLFIVGLFFVLFLSLHGAIIYERVAAMYEAGEIAKNRQLMTFLELFAKRLEVSPLAIRFNAYTSKWLMWGGGGWLAICMAYKNNQKNYIHGKEFGTTRWGTRADIQDLFASTLEANDIRRAKKIRFPLGRWLVKRDIYKECEKAGAEIQKARLLALQEAEDARNLEGTGNKKLYREDQKRIKQETVETIALSKQQRWKPDGFKAAYEIRVKEIKETAFLSNEGKVEQIKAAEQEYKAQLAEFYDPAKQIAKIKAKYKDADMLFTSTEWISFYNFVLNQNTLVLGGSGSGKTRGYVMPNILQAHSSYIITDPKGEILEKAGYFLTKIKGYKVRVLNLDEKADSDYYNPFVYIHPERPGYEERVLDLIETIIVNTDGGEKKNSSDPFWPMAERLFLQSIFFFVADGFVEEDRNMNTVHMLISMLKIAEEADNMDSDLDLFVRQFKKEHGEKHIGVQQYEEFRNKAAGKTAKSVVISAVARLAPFKTSEVRRLFERDSMLLDRVGEEKTAIFVVVPPTTSTFNFIAGMLFTQLFQELQYCATQKHKHEGQRLPVPVRFILDEFSNTCVIPNFVKILAYARSFGIGITPILQSLEQIKNMYEKEWGVIIDNCNTLLYLGSITHMDTLEYMSKLVGKGTFDKRTTGMTRGRSGSSSRNEDVVGRELMLPDDIRRLPKKDCLFLVGGRYPFYSEKYKYESHPNYRFTSDANKEFSFDIKEYRKEQAEEERREAAHREEAARITTPSENAKVEVTEVRIEDSPAQQLTLISNNMSKMDVISDEDLHTDEGEGAENAVNKMTLQELVGNEDVAREQSKRLLSAESQAYMAKVDQEQIRIEESMFVMVNSFGRAFRSMAIVQDEDLHTDEGEGMTYIDELYGEILMDDENGASPEELGDIVEDTAELFAMLTDSIEAEGIE